MLYIIYYILYIIYYILYIIYYILYIIRHRAARHQGSVSSALALLVIWNCSFKGGRGGWPSWPGGDPHDFFAGMFFDRFFVSIFYDYTFKKPPKMESKSNPNRWKHDVGSHLEKLSKNVAKICDFSLTFQEADVLKT